jgi:hypothetical protein
MGNNGVPAMDLDDLLLLIAFRRQLREPDAGAGHARVEAVAGRLIDAAEFAAALRRLVSEGLIHDPIFLPAAALQCHWRLEPTPEGVTAVQALVRESGKSVDALIASPTNA